MNLTYIVCLASVVATWAICANAGRIGSALGLMDDPRCKAHGLHTTITPMVGGLAILGPWIIASIASHPHVNDPAHTGMAGFTSPILGCFLAFFLALGALDDRYQLSAQSRLWTKSVAFLALVLLLEHSRIIEFVLPSVHFRLALGLWAVPFTVLCLVTLTNVVNMADGRNGLVIGMCLIWFAALANHLELFADPLLLAILASLAITGWFNWRGRLFLGDAGTYALSALVGMLAIWVHNQGLDAGGVSSGQMAALFAIPFFDMCRLIIVRHRRKVSILAADHDHLHHRIDRCMGWNRGLPLYLAIVAVPILVAFISPKTGSLGLIVALALYLAVWRLTRAAEATSPSTAKPHSLQNAK